MNYLELKDTIEMYVERDDIKPKLTMFLRLLEAHLNQEFASVVTLQEVSTLTTDQAINNVLGLGKVFMITLDDTQLQYTFNGSSDVGKPYEYSLSKDVIKLYPSPDSTYTFTVVHSTLLSPLLTEAGTIADTDTNWILTQAPNIYIYGLLWQVYLYLDSSLADKYFGLLMGSIKKFISHNAPRNIKQEGYHDSLQRKSFTS